MTTEEIVWCIGVVVGLCLAILAAHVWYNIELEQQADRKQIEDDFYDEVPQ